MLTDKRGQSVVGQAPTDPLSPYACKCAVEGWFAQLERRALYRGVFSNVADLKKELKRFIRFHNSDLVSRSGGQRTPRRFWLRYSVPKKCYLNSRSFRVVAISATVRRQNQVAFNVCVCCQVTRELAMSDGNGYLKFGDFPVMHNSGNIKLRTTSCS